jgi:hypothetical protein
VHRAVVRDPGDQAVAGLVDRRVGQHRARGAEPEDHARVELLVLEHRAERRRARRAAGVAVAAAADVHARRPDVVGDREAEAVDRDGRVERRAEEPAGDRARLQAAGAVLEELAVHDPGEARIVLDVDVRHVRRAARVAAEVRDAQWLRVERDPRLEHLPGEHVAALAPHDERDAVGGDGHPRPPVPDAGGARRVPVEDRRDDGEVARAALLARDHHVRAAEARRGERQIPDAVDREVDRRLRRRAGDEQRADVGLVRGGPDHAVQRPARDERDRELAVVARRDDRLRARRRQAGV